MKKNEFQEELDKFIGSVVLVKDMFGDTHKGQLMGYKHGDLSIILMTEENKILIKNYHYILRERDGSWKKNDKKV